MTLQLISISKGDGFSIQNNALASELGFVTKERRSVPLSLFCWKPSCLLYSLSRFCWSVSRLELRELWEAACQVWYSITQRKEGGRWREKRPNRRRVKRISWKGTREQWEACSFGFEHSHIEISRISNEKEHSVCGREAFRAVMAYDCLCAL